MPNTPNNEVVDAHYEIIEEEPNSSYAIYNRNTIFKEQLADVVTMPAADRIVALDAMRAALPAESKAGFVLYTHKIDPRYKYFAAGHYTVGNSLTALPAFVPMSIHSRVLALVVSVGSACCGYDTIRKVSDEAKLFSQNYSDDDKVGYPALLMEYADWFLARDETTSPTRGRALLAGCANGSMHNGISAIVRFGAIIAGVVIEISCTKIQNLSQYVRDEIDKRRSLDERHISKVGFGYSKTAKLLTAVENNMGQCGDKIVDYVREKIIGPLNPNYISTISEFEQVLTNRATERAAKRAAKNAPKAPALHS